jgi:hypothetical protein
MKIIYRYLLLILCLTGCSSRAEVADEYRYWSYSITVPPYFQINTEYLQASMPDGHIMDLMAGGVVGLCQIGAAVMGEKGYKYDEILMHYFRNAELKRIY